MQHFYHVDQANVLRLSHVHYVEKLARHLFSNNAPATMEVNRLFSTKTIPHELVKAKARNLIFHPPH